MQYDFDFSVVLDQADRLLLGCLWTLGLSLLSMCVGMVAAVAIILLRTSKSRLPAFLAGVYVQLFRNTPFLVQIYFIYFGFPAMGIRFDSNTAALIALSANFAAYSSEIIRGGITSVPRGQTEAGLALGLGTLETFFYIVLKPAVRKVYPALVSQFVLLMLMTSVASSVGATELTTFGQEIEYATYRSFEVYFTLSVIYLSMAVMLSFTLSRVDKYIFRYPL
ncbi:amino acid ABC transporter permease [Shinella sp. S4-D37]|uniref:amino acid ABC transporter permease n=1 Tax=Shinella sp. S4-D37 TaxID=3161999 RepID=UPI00346509AD